MTQQSTRRSSPARRGHVSCSDMEASSPTYFRAVRGNTRPIYRGEDYTGRAIGNWTVLGPIECKKSEGSNNYMTKWLCQCSCGSDAKWTIKENLFQGRSRGCNDCYGTRTTAADNPNWKGFGEISGEVIHRVRSGAKARNLDIEVSLQDLNALWLLQGKSCALTGIPLVLLDTASLDRVDSDLGYVTGNIQWVHKFINKMKNDLPEQVFVEMCKAVATHSRHDS